jgi:hypothetical protein
MQIIGRVWLSSELAFLTKCSSRRTQVPARRKRIARTVCPVANCGAIAVSTLAREFGQGYSLRGYHQAAKILVATLNLPPEDATLPDSAAFPTGNGAAMARA